MKLTNFYDNDYNSEINLKSEEIEENINEGVGLMNYWRSNEFKEILNDHKKLESYFESLADKENSSKINCNVDPDKYLVKNERNRNNYKNNKNNYLKNKHVKKEILSKSSMINNNVNNFKNENFLLENNMLSIKIENEFDSPLLVLNTLDELDIIKEEYDINFEKSKISEFETNFNFNKSPLYKFSHNYNFQENNSNNNSFYFN